MKTQDFYRQIALNYRLSLDFMAKLLKKSEEDTYKYLFTPKTYEAIPYLFQYETPFDNEKTKKSKELACLNYISRFKQASKEEKSKLLYSLVALDQAYQQIKDKATNKMILAQEEYETIAKYRLKYAISRKNIAQDLTISRNSIMMHEEYIEDEKIKKQLEELNQFYRAQQMRAVGIKK